MPRYTDNLGLRLPEKQEYFRISDWNANMQLLDSAYGILSGQSQRVTASLVAYDNSTSGLSAINVQGALDEIGKNSSSANVYFIEADHDMTITIATYAHIYVVLSFGSTVPNITFAKSIAGKDFVWEGGEPVFQANSTYELSFLHLDCKWFKR